MRVPDMRGLFVATALLAASSCFAQESNSGAQQPIAYVPLDGVKVSGALDVSNGRASIGISGTITAGDRTATIALVRGGELRLCASTTVHLTTDRSVNQTGNQTGNQAGNQSGSTAPSAALLIALDRGALEASYTPAKYSDVILTPDFRILVSGPGTADLKVRVSPTGDTCIDNHGASSPYVTVSSQFDNGVYRVQPNQRVLFEHGSLRDVVDNESEPCGCPPAAQTLATAQLGVGLTPPANPAPSEGSLATPAANSAKPAIPEAKPTVPDSKPGTEFPLAVSEGLAPPPAPPTTPVAAPGEVHAQVTVPLAYEGTTGKSTSAADGATNVPAVPDVATTLAPTPAVAAAPAPPGNKPEPRPGFFHSIGHFFSRLFGGG